MAYLRTPLVDIRCKTIGYYRIEEDLDRRCKGKIQDTVYGPVERIGVTD